MRGNRRGNQHISTVTLKLSGLPALKPGVYHLRLKSSDPSVPRLEKYCAFEVMS